MGGTIHESLDGVLSDLYMWCLYDAENKNYVITETVRELEQESKGEWDMLDQVAFLALTWEVANLCRLFYFDGQDNIWSLRPFYISLVDKFCHVMENNSSPWLVSSFLLWWWRHHWGIKAILYFIFVNISSCFGKQQFYELEYLVKFTSMYFRMMVTPHATIFIFVLAYYGTKFLIIMLFLS